MAGIAFELKKILRKKSLSSIFTAFGYSFALSSGPYFITIISLILISFLMQSFVEKREILTQFQVSVTHIIAFSLILSGLINLYLIRFLADILFMKKVEAVVPNMMGAVLINMSLGFFLSFPFSMIFIAPHASYSFAFLFSFAITTLMGVWTLNIILTGFKSYKYILFSYALSYALFIVFSFIFVRFGLSGLIFAFALSNFLIFSLFLSYLLKNHYSSNLLSFDFLKEKRYRSLMLTGFFYNFGLWADKLIFWYHPYTSTSVLGPLSYSVVYDIPIFLAYLSIAPGISTMFLKIEWEFAEYYERYYDAVRGGSTLDKIYLYGDELIRSARSVLLDTFRVQLIFSIFIVIIQEPVFNLFRIPKIYTPLFDILLFGTTMQVVLLCILSLMFYFNKLNYALITTFIFATSNFLLSLMSIYIGPFFYGYGFVVSVFLSLIIGIILLRRFLHDIHYYTFMHI
ncbi:MAG: exopolysaccharide Pel transporter PelG [Aquificaceae bacterium]|nr:exopolysaccharide Pel transporter PelG [Aquificaceae bacterium]MDW8423386.1 exopolysaccharide Pel transporter PelG [Aquificaceae bacterium]